MATIGSFTDEQMKGQARRVVVEGALVKTSRLLGKAEPKPPAAVKAYREAKDMFHDLDGMVPSEARAADILALLEIADRAIRRSADHGGTPQAESRVGAEDAPGEPKQNGWPASLMQALERRIVDAAPASVLWRRDPLASQLVFRPWPRLVIADEDVCDGKRRVRYLPPLGKTGQ